MLTIRPFRNSDVSILLDLWKKSQCRNADSRLIPLSMNNLQLQVLGPPMFDNRSIILAFDEQRPVGYVHTTLGPTPDGFDLDCKTGQICFLAADPDYAEVENVVRALLDAAERYLIGLGVEKIYGGSPRPCAPFYIGFHGGAEAIGFFDSETHLIRAFQQAGYETFKTTIRFRLDLFRYELPFNNSIFDWVDKIEVKVFDLPKAKTWWEACSFAHFEWCTVIAKQKDNGRPLARALVRIANPDTMEESRLYKGSWDAALMDVRVHQDFRRQGIAAFTLWETLRYLANLGRIMQIEAHIDEDSAMLYPLLRLLQWKEIDTGKIFLKSVDKR